MDFKSLRTKSSLAVIITAAVLVEITSGIPMAILSGSNGDKPRFCPSLSTFYCFAEIRTIYAQQSSELQ